MAIPANQINVVEIAVSGNITGGGSNTVKTVNIFHYRRTTVINLLNKTNIDAIFDSTVTAKLALALNNRWTQLHNAIRFVNDALDAPVFFSHAAVGAVAGDGMTTIETAFFLFQSGVRGRSYRGSKKVGPMSEADTTAPNEDIFNAAALTRLGVLNTAMATPLTDANGNVWVPTILSRLKSQLTLNPTNVSTVDVSSILLNKRVGRLRRREVKSVY